MRPTPLKAEILWKTSSWTRRIANHQCPGAAGSRGPIHPAAPTPPRQALIDRVRREIAGGTYETRAKVNALLPRLAQDVWLATHPRSKEAEERKGRRNPPAAEMRWAVNLADLEGARPIRSVRAEPFREVGMHRSPDPPLLWPRHRTRQRERRVDAQPLARSNTAPSTARGCPFL